jgi:hypothetical protein
LLNMRDEYSGLPAVDSGDLIEDEDDEGGLVFWSIICCVCLEKSSGNKLLSVVWISTYTKKKLCYNKFFSAQT